MPRASESPGYSRMSGLASLEKTAEQPAFGALLSRDEQEIPMAIPGPTLNLSSAGRGELRAGCGQRPLPDPLLALRCHRQFRFGEKRICQLGIYLHFLDGDSLYRNGWILKP